MDPEAVTDNDVDRAENDSGEEDGSETSSNSAQVVQDDLEETGEQYSEEDQEEVATTGETGGTPDAIETTTTQDAVEQDDDLQNDEGIEEGDVDESKKDDTHSSRSDSSLIGNVESFTSIDDSKSTELVTPPTKQQSSSPRSSVSSSAESSSVKRRTSQGVGKKRKSNDFKPTVVKPFSFTLDKRIEDRQKYNDKVHKMQKAQEERERLERERQEKEEEEQLKKQRKKTIPKANPIRHYKPITITPSKKALTMPEAPKLCLENRNRAPKVADKHESSPRGGGNKLKQVL